MPDAHHSNVVAAIAAVLVVVAAAVGIVACGGGLAVAPNDREFAFRADFAPKETSPRDALARTARIIDRRLRARHIEGSARPAGGDRIAVRLPAGERSELASLTAPGHLFFFDWEATVLGADGRPHPGDPAVTGGSSAGISAGLRYYDAVLRAARRPGGGSSSTGDQYYVVSDRARTVRRGPVGSPAEVHRSRGERIVKVRAGTLVVRGEADPSTHRPAATYYVINEAPAVPGTELTDVREGDDFGPSVSFDLTLAGRSAFHGLTRTIAHRGRARRAVQHFAAALDGELLTVPMIDYRQTPDGITITKGVELDGGFTKRSARNLVLLLRLGPLPVVRLVAVGA